MARIRNARPKNVSGSFCELLEIDYGAIIEARKADGPDNVSFFLSELVKIDGIRPHLLELLNG